jgi:hypothetical protein
MLQQAALLCSNHVPMLSSHVQMLSVTEFGGGRWGEMMLQHKALASSEMVYLVLFSHMQM